MAGETSSRVVVAKITTVYGVKGWVKIHSFTQPMQNFLEYGHCQVRKNGHWQELEIDQSRIHGKGIVAHISGVDDREQARDYCGLELSVAVDELPALQDDEFYWHQLVGLAVYTSRDQQLLGKVDHLIETGANDVLVVKPCKGSIDDRERLIPYLPGQYIGAIELDEGRLTAEWDPEF